jgi:hypothetical protein
MLSLAPVGWKARVYTPPIQVVPKKNSISAPAVGSLRAGPIRSVEIDAHNVLTWVDSNRLQLKSSTRTIATAWSPAAVIAIGGSDTALAVAGQTAAAIWMGGSLQATVSTAPVSP